MIIDGIMSLRIYFILSFIVYFILIVRIFKNVFFREKKKKRYGKFFVFYGNF